MLTLEPVQPVTHPILIFFPLTPHTAPPHPSFLLPCPLLLLLSHPFPKATQLVAPYSHQLTPPAPPSLILPTSFGFSPCISISSTLPLPFFLHSALTLGLPRPWLKLGWACCPVGLGDKWELSHSGFVLAARSVGSGGPAEFLMSVCSYNHLRWRCGSREGCRNREKGGRNGEKEREKQRNRRKYHNGLNIRQFIFLDIRLDKVEVIS